MKIVFFGTPEYVLPILTRIHKEYVTGPGKSPIVAVVTQPPKPIGRKQIMQYSPIDKWAHEHGIDTRYDLSEDLPDADLGIVAAYGGMIPNEVINKFPHGLLVVHPSLLPQFRWASPIQAAITTDTNPTGITIMKMDDKFDHGPIVTQSKEEILETDTAGTLRERLFAKSVDLIIELMEPYLKNKINLKPQDHDKATFAREIKKADAFVDIKHLKLAMEGKSIKEMWQVPFIKDCEIELTPRVINNFVRAMDPWPFAWTLTPDEKRLKILKSHLEKDEKGKETLVIDEVQREGKVIVTWKQFIEGHPGLLEKVN